MLEIYRDTCASTLILTVVGFLCGAGYNFTVSATATCPHT